MAKLFDGEYKLMELIWQYAPVGSTRLVQLANEKLDWKKSTTYTVLRKLAEKGALKNENATVTPLITREEVLREEGEALVEKSGGLPMFLTAFLGGRPLTPKEREQLQALIDRQDV